MKYKKSKVIQKKNANYNGVGKKAFQLKDNRSSSLLKNKQTAQLIGLDEDEDLQLKEDAAQKVELNEEDEEHPMQQKKNTTGLPDKLKSGMENLTGMNLDHVQTHYNSSKPATMQAHAYAQGSTIHLASGQEKHLPHELAHIVQQAKGLVKPTTSINGMAVNDDVKLEREADMMGEKAVQLQVEVKKPKKNESSAVANAVAQRRNGNKIANNQLFTKTVTQLVHGSFDNVNYAGAIGTVLGAAATLSQGNGDAYSQVLRAGLVTDSGVPDSNIDMINQISNQAHHIVERSDANAAFSRMLLAGANIDLDAPINGVLLPSENHDDAIGVTRHLGSHKAAYAQRVNQSLSQAINAAPVPAGGWPGVVAGTVATQIYNALIGGVVFTPLQSTALRNILTARLLLVRQVLLQNSVPINNGVDGDYDPVTDAEITIDQIFTNNGL